MTQCVALQFPGKDFFSFFFFSFLKFILFYLWRGVPGQRASMKGRENGRDREV